MPVATKPKRPRLTVSLSDEDYQLLAERYGIAPERKLEIKEKVTADLILFADNEE